MTCQNPGEKPGENAASDVGGFERRHVNANTLMFADIFLECNDHGYDQMERVLRVMRHDFLHSRPKQKRRQHAKSCMLRHQCFSVSGQRSLCPCLMPSYGLTGALWTILTELLASYFHVQKDSFCGTTLVF
jgi:hypothetical protein